jgi:superfamily II DNA or RNA helicase
MPLVYSSPSRLTFEGYDAKGIRELERQLAYVNRSVDYELHRLKKSGQSWGFSEKWKARVAELTAERAGSLFKTDENGSHYTYTGLAGYLAKKTSDTVVNNLKYPAPKKMPWAEKFPHALYPYQTKALEALLAIKHGSVEIATGLGKSFIILHLVKALGLKTVVMAPSQSIAKQLLRDFTKYLGKKYVGQYYGGKKEPKKQIIVAVSNSLTLIDPVADKEHWDLMQQVQVFCADESHQCAAETLAKVCLDLFANVPYRFFFSATQIRQDGLELLLESIIGPVVYSMSLRQGVDEGYLAKPIFSMVQTYSPSTYKSHDANKMTRTHLLYNPVVNATAADLANNFCDQGQQVLILIDELEQFSHLLPHLRHEVGFAHAAKNAEAKSKIPPEYHDSDPTALVAKFNEGKLPILVGTSCIGCGTDVKSNAATINLVGGKSEIQVRQGPIGRSTRKHPLVGKTTCHIIDFCVANVDITLRHANERKTIYDYEYGPVRTVTLASASQS